MNLVVVKHRLNSDKPYLFRVPEDVELSPMVDVLVDNVKGKSLPAVAITPSFNVPKWQLPAVCAAYGTTPEALQSVVGFRFEVAVHFDDDKAVAFWSEVMRDWNEFDSDGGDDDEDDGCDGDCENCPAYDAEDE